MPASIFQLLTHSFTTLSSVACDLVRVLVLVSRSRRALAAENLFLRKQPALFHERKVKPHRGNDSTSQASVVGSVRLQQSGAEVCPSPDGQPSNCWQHLRSLLRWV